MTSRMQQRRDTAANWTTNNPTLAAGELGLETNTGLIKIGTGSTAWTALAYATTGTVTSVIAGTGLSGGTITNAGTISIDTAVTTDLTTAQTLTNKTLTAPIINLAFNAQTGTTYTLVAADRSKLVTSSNGAAVTITIPTGVFAAGEQINIQSIGVGLTTISGAAVTITSTGASAIAPILRARYSAATIICTAAGVFTVIGDIA